MMASVQGVYLSSHMCSLVSCDGFVALSLILFIYTNLLRIIHVFSCTGVCFREQNLPQIIYPQF